MRISWGRASRCARSLGNPARPGDSDQQAARRAGRTCATKTAIHATTKASARLSARLRGKRWTGRLSVSCDKRLHVPREVAFLYLGLELEPAIEVLRRSWQPQGPEFLLGCSPP